VSTLHVDLGVTGRVLDVVRAPAAVLSTPSPAVDPTDPSVVQLAADLVATMRVSPGCVGLAAPQVGVGRRRGEDASGRPDHVEHAAPDVRVAHSSSASA